jgi:hypothetical protein
VRNSILWGNSAPQIFNSGDSAATVTNSVVQGGYPDGTNIIDTDPLLGSLGHYGGSTETHALLPGSSAINATDSECPAYDQRGVLRSTPVCDIGAYESRGFNLAYIGGSRQSATVGNVFANALVLEVTSPYDEPVDGGAVTFSAPASGAGIHPTTHTATIENDTVSQTVTANATAGVYTVTAGARGANDLDFTLTNNDLDFTLPNENVPGSRGGCFLNTLMNGR